MRVTRIQDASTIRLTFCLEVLLLFFMIIRIVLFDCNEIYILTDYLSLVVKRRLRA